MKRKIIDKKRLFITIAVLIIISVFAQIPALAASPTYNMSSDFKRSKYYDNFRAVELCGDGARDTLAIALSQLGYHEGNDNSGRDGLSIDGNRDFVEYNVLYGKLDNNQGNGISYGYYWCASFVNWCLRQAEVSKAASAAAEVSCRRWLSACQSAGIYHEKNGYVPQSADIIFFKSSSSQATSSHMGLVLYCDGSTVYTIEGNTSNGSAFSANGNYVALKSYKLSSSYIVGYATPIYNTSENVGEIDYSCKNFYAGKYISTEEIKIYSDNAFNGEIGKIGAFTVFDVESVDGNTLYISGGVIKAENVRQISAKNDIRSLSYLDINGKKIYTNQYATVGENVTVSDEIPERSNAHFIGWMIAKNEAMLSPGDTVTLDENIELIAIYDDTKIPSIETTKPVPATSYPEPVESNETSEKTSEESVETERSSQEIQITDTTEDIGEQATEFMTENLTEAGDIDTTPQTEHISNETETRAITSKSTALGTISSLFGCSITIGTTGSSAIIASLAVSGIIFHKKTNKKDKK